MLKGNNTNLIGTREGLYASPHVMKDDQADDASIINDIKEKFYVYPKGGIKALPAVIFPLKSALIPGNPDVAPVPLAGGEYAPRRARIAESRVNA